jgi:hypothetical protein
VLLTRCGGFAMTRIPQKLHMDQTSGTSGLVRSTHTTPTIEGEIVGRKPRQSEKHNDTQSRKIRLKLIFSVGFQTLFRSYSDAFQCAFSALSVLGQRPYATVSLRGGTDAMTITIKTQPYRVSPCSHRLLTVFHRLLTVFHRLLTVSLLPPTRLAPVSDGYACGMRVYKNAGTFTSAISALGRYACVRGGATW